MRSSDLACQLVQIAGRLIGLDARRADEIFEMMSQLADMLGRREDEIHAADVDRGTFRPEHRIGHREVLASVEQEPAIAGIALGDEALRMFELGAAVLAAQVAPDPLAARKKL